MHTAGSSEALIERKMVLCMERRESGLANVQAIKGIKRTLAARKFAAPRTGRVGFRLDSRAGVRAPAKGAIAGTATGREAYANGTWHRCQSKDWGNNQDLHNKKRTAPDTQNNTYKYEPS